MLCYKLVYDVQENYRANLDLNPGLTTGAKRKASRLIQNCESKKAIDLYLLAEKCYANEMPEKRPFLILENKYQGEIIQKGPLQFTGKKDFRFSITGTITPAFGTWDAIGWFLEIIKSYPESKLEIVGHCPIDSFRDDLLKASTDHPQLSLRIDRNPIPHQDLIDCLTRSDFALLPYQSHPAITNKMPTKLYECAALGIPVLVSPNPIWNEFLAEFNGGYSVDFSNRSKAIVEFNEALNRTFFSSTAPQSILWKTEKVHFQQAIQNLLS
jgi:glycosyltransferase involved in cell wall biosynthesis